MTAGIGAESVGRVGRERGEDLPDLVGTGQRRRGSASGLLQDGIGELHLEVRGTQG